MDLPPTNGPYQATVGSIEVQDDKGKIRRRVFDKVNERERISRMK